MEELWVLVSVKYDEKLGHKVYVFGSKSRF